MSSYLSVSYCSYTFRLVWSRMILMLTKQPRSSFLARALDIVGAKGGSWVVGFALAGWLCVYTEDAGVEMVLLLESGMRAKADVPTVRAGLPKPPGLPIPLHFCVMTDIADDLLLHPNGKMLSHWRLYSTIKSKQTVMFTAHTHTSSN